MDERKLSGVDLKETDDSEKITRLIIVKDRDWSNEREDTGVKYQYKPMMIQRGDSDKVFEFYKLQNLSNTRKIEVLMIDHEGTELRAQLPTEMLDRIAEYVRTERDLDGKFNCFDFVSFINNVPTESDLNEDRWDIEPLDLEHLQPGENVVIASEHENHQWGYEHAATYLGNDLYISQYGTRDNDGRLIVSDLEEMMKCYGATGAAKITPKADANPAEEA